jgi:DNA-binding XRE family transcriptional regulator
MLPQAQRHNRFLSFRPTSALPGTEEKILVLEARAASHQPLFHADDATADDDRALLLLISAANGHRLGQKAFREGFLPEACRPQALPAERFCGRLKKLRREAGLTQRALAVRAQLDWNTIARLERGARAPRLGTIRRLAEALAVSLAALTS